MGKRIFIYSLLVLVGLLLLSLACLVLLAGGYVG